MKKKIKIQMITTEVIVHEEEEFDVSGSEWEGLSDEEIRNAIIEDYEMHCKGNIIKREELRCETNIYEVN